MKTSRFNVVTNYDETGETLFFNTLTGAFYAADTDTSTRIDQLLSDPTEASNADCLAQFLYEKGFLVDDEVDEHELVLQRSLLGIGDPNRLDVIVMPNMNCNFACTYCYESHHQSAMSDETASRLMSWLDRMVPQFKVVLLSWFGGEPLLSYDRVVQIQHHVLNLCSQCDSRFSCHVTTNGFLLTPERSAELLELESYSYQITLDGIPAVQNVSRPLRGGGPTFDVVMRNMCALVRLNKHVNVKLRINYDEATLDQIPDLLAQVPDDVRPQLDVVYERIFGQEFSKYHDGMSGRRVGMTVERLYEYAKELGFSVTMNPLGPRTLTYCYADRKSEFLVNYNGDVFKCTVDKFASKDRLGWLDVDGTIQWEGDRLDQWHSVPTFEEKCFSCTFMPMCMGGCRKLRFREKTVGDDCKLPFMGFDKRLQYRYARERGDALPRFQREPTRPSAAGNELLRVLN